MSGQTFTGREQSAANTFQVLASAARTSTPAVSYFPNVGNAKGIRVYIETTAAGTSPSTTFAIQVKDPINTQYHTLVTSVAVTATGRTFIEVYPGGDAIANVRATYHVGRGIRVLPTHGNSTSHTYNIVGEWLP